MSICLSFVLSIYGLVYLFTYIPVHLSTCLPVYCHFLHSLQSISKTPSLSLLKTNQYISSSIGILLECYWINQIGCSLLLKSWTKICIHTKYILHIHTHAQIQFFSKVYQNVQEGLKRKDFQKKIIFDFFALRQVSKTCLYVQIIDLINQE